MEGKWKAFLEHARESRKLPGKNQLLLVFLAGLLLLVVVYPASGQTGGGGQEDAQDLSQDSQLSGGAYEKYLEERIGSALGHVEGVGRAEVVITLKSSGQKVVEKDLASSSQTVSEEDSAGGTRATEDRTSDRTSVYTHQTDGSQAPYVSKELTPEIEGVVVIADGGDNPVVVQNITEAIQALFGVEAHKIKIMKRTDT